MPFYLAPHEGRGTLRDPFRPVGSDRQQGWSAIDMGGISFLHLPNPDRRLKKLTDDRRETPGTRGTNLLVDKLGASPGRLDLIVARLLRRPTSGRWKPLRPSRRGYEVYLGGERIYWEPVIRGGATDNFTRSDETPLASPWTKISNSNVNLVSNAAEKSANSDNTYYYYASAATSEDQYSQAVEGSVAADWGPSVRISGGSGTENAYTYDPYAFGAPGGIFKYQAGSFGNLGAGTAYTAGDVLYIEADGSTITGMRNGSLSGAPTPITNSDVTGGQPGLWMYASGVQADTWEGGDLDAPEPVIYVKTGKGVIG